MTAPPSSGPAWAADVLRFWFGLDPKQWWSGGPELDHRIGERFLSVWSEKRQLPVASFLDDPLIALAGTVLFDQFPRHMFRGEAEQYSTDHLAAQISRGAVDRGYDDQLESQEKLFLYMPLMHSESMADQQRSLVLFTALGTEQAGYARHHHDLIARFGRFPHRNAILGRAPRPEEAAADAGP